MGKALHTQLRIPAEERFLRLVQGHIRDLAHAAGFPDKDVLALELAAEEAFQNICTHAYPDGTPGDIIVNGEMLEGELRLEFMDEGLPFDPALLNSQPKQMKSETSGLGLKLIHHSVDEVRWVNRGRQGKAMCLVKQMPVQDAAYNDTQTAALSPTDDHHPRSEQVQASRHPVTQKQSFIIRPLQPEDALQVARLFWLTYGYSYKNEAFYRPEGLLDLVTRGVLMSYVAVTQGGEVAGHAGLLRPEPVPMAELALLVVSPLYRGQGLMQPFFSALTNQAHEMGLFGLSFNSVTSHPVSQRKIIKIGAYPCGLDLGACPPRQFKAMALEDGPRPRESFLHCFLYLKEAPPAVAYVPKRHQRIVRLIYENLGRYPASAKDLASSDQGLEQRQEGFYTVSFDRGLLKGVVRVKAADERQWPEIRRATEDLIDIAGAEAVNLDLPLAQPSTADLCELAEAAGFFFAGVWPHAAEDGDMLRLIRLPAPMNMNTLQLHSDFSNELAQYVGKEMDRAMGVK